MATSQSSSSVAPRNLSKSSDTYRVIQELNSSLSSTSLPIISHVSDIIGCDCRCHDILRLSTPRGLEKILGHLRVGIHGHLWLSKECNQPRCQGSQRRVFVLDYVFPTWLWSRILSIRLCTNSVTGSKALTLRLLRYCPFNAPVFRALRSGQGLQRCDELFQSGQASPFDVNPDGNTPLHIRSLKEFEWNKLKCK